MNASKSFAVERTQLAWRRTSLALLVFSLLSIKVSIMQHSSPLVVITLIAIATSASAYYYSLEKSASVAALIAMQGFITALLAVVVVSSIY